MKTYIGDGSATLVGRIDADALRPELTWATADVEAFSLGVSHDQRHDLRGMALSYVGNVRSRRNPARMMCGAGRHILGEFRH